MILKWNNFLLNFIILFSKHQEYSFKTMQFKLFEQYFHDEFFVFIYFKGLVPSERSQDDLQPFNNTNREKPQEQFNLTRTCKNRIFVYSQSNLQMIFPYKDYTCLNKMIHQIDRKWTVSSQAFFNKFYR